ncbi:DUF748 domain-containing protein [Pontibacter virosus]|uniref:Uncharacterized protein DUF748 n=1 Tax=Pontibacter virosus TaxID=1765052 RepID=A0A2U1AWK4_9BACT|nr:DUF748 domain-containing protein [Pontibacter virosus]PVY40741.1 uncharacterized protein DUF748 [Pontibacter virosus]
MNNKTLFHKWWLWLLVILTVLFIIIGILTSQYFTPWLQHELESRVKDESNGLYTLKLHGLDSSLLSGRISADSVQLVPNFEAWDKRQDISQQDTSATKAPRTLIDLKTNKLVLAGINFIGVLRGNPLDLSKLQVIQPTILITEMRQDTTESHEPLHDAVDGIMKQLRIGAMEVEEATLRIRERQDAETDRISLEKLTISIKDFRLDSTAFQDKERAYYARQITLESGQAAFALPDGTYKLEATALKANTEDGTLNIGNLKLIPLLDNAALARLKGRAVSTMRLEVPEINVSGVDYKVHSQYNNLVADKVVLRNPSLSAYMDRKNFSPKGDKPLPHDIIQQLKTGLTLQKVEVQGMHIRYEELAEEATEKGIITFENLSATISNVTNDKNRMSAKSPAVVDAKASVYGKAPVALTIRLNLLDPDGFHTLQGTAGPADLAVLNPILEPTAFISLKEGSLQKSDFKIDLYRNKASGNLNVRYQNFKVDVLTKDEDKRQSLGKKILSKVANKVVIKSDNPEEGEQLRAGDIAVVRAKKRSVFNYWKDCLVSGFRTAAGVEGIGADLRDPNR